MLAHSVYFSLQDNSVAARRRLIDACRQQLSAHPGTVYFAVGEVNQQLARAVNDRNFDVALLLVFKDKQAHDAYQEAPLHNTFIREQQANWKQVRVFDADVE